MTQGTEMEWITDCVNMTNERNVRIWFKKTCTGTERSSALILMRKNLLEMDKKVIMVKKWKILDEQKCC